MSAMATSIVLTAAVFLLFFPQVGLSSDRRVPKMPVSGQKIPVIIDTDAACEIDDLYAIALAVLCQDRFDIKGFHDVVLEAGPVPLDLLGELVRGWAS